MKDAPPVPSANAIQRGSAMRRGGGRSCAYDQSRCPGAGDSNSRKPPVRSVSPARPWPAAGVTTVLAAQAAFAFEVPDAGNRSATPALSTSYPAEYNTPATRHGLPGGHAYPRHAHRVTPGPAPSPPPGTVIDGKGHQLPHQRPRPPGWSSRTAASRVSNDKPPCTSTTSTTQSSWTPRWTASTPTTPAAAISLIGDGSYTCVRCNLHGSGDPGPRQTGAGVAIRRPPGCTTTTASIATATTTTIQSTGWTDSCTANIEGPRAGRRPAPTPPRPGTASAWCTVGWRTRNNQTSNILLKADLGAIHTTSLSRTTSSTAAATASIGTTAPRTRYLRRPRPQQPVPAADASVPCKNPDGTLKAVSPNLGSTKRTGRQGLLVVWRFASAQWHPTSR